VYNTAVAFDGAGELVASYRKLHLFDAFGHRESEEVAPGSAPVLVTLAGMRTGLEICYDVRFGELSRALAVAGADLLVLPAAWAAGPLKEEHWLTLVRARAIENTVWVAAAGQVPDPDEPPTRAATGIGRSILVDPLGVVRSTSRRCGPSGPPCRAWLTAGKTCSGSRSPSPASERALSGSATARTPGPRRPRKR
jgi:deaminated glutathione amidase